MNEVDFDVSRLPALRKAKPDAATSRHSQLDLEGKKKVLKNQNVL